MYKKICMILLVMLLLCSCSADTSQTTPENTNSPSTENTSSQSTENASSPSTSIEIESVLSQQETPHYCLQDLDVILKQDKNFKIYTNEEHTTFSYYIRDDSGYLMDSGYHDYRGSFDIYQKGDFLTLDYGFGGNSWHERYYDVSNGRVSRFFERPVESSNELVAYFTFRDSDNAIVLVIQNVFDRNTYYKEIERDFSDFVFKIAAEGEFLENDTKLKLTYWRKPDDQEVTEIIDLSE